MIHSAATTSRERARIQIARQIAIHEGYIWQQHPDAKQIKKQAQLMTLAGNILATVERLQSNVAWKRAEQMVLQ